MGNQFAKPDSDELEREHIILSDREHKVAELYFGKNLGPSDIAERLDIAETTVYNYKNRAKKKIEKQSEQLMQMLKNQAWVGNRENLHTVAQEAETLSLEYGLGDFNMDE